MTRTDPPETLPCLLTVAEAALATGVDVAELHRLVLAGDGPERTRLDGWTGVRFTPAHLEEWAAR